MREEHRRWIVGELSSAAINLGQTAQLWAPHLGRRPMATNKPTQSGRCSQLKILVMGKKRRSIR